jgi:tetratricopeptide (TPR) repeat protein
MPEALSCGKGAMLVVAAAVFSSSALARAEMCVDSSKAAAIELASGDATQAARTLEAKLGPCARCPELHFWLAHAYRRLGRSREAIKQLEVFVSLEPKKSNGYRFLGELLLGEGRRSEAVSQLHHSLELDSDQPGVKALLIDAERIAEPKGATPNQPAPGATPIHPAVRASAPPTLARLAAKPSAPLPIVSRLRDEGLAGLYGGRSAWWARALALAAFFVLSAVLISVQAARHARQWRASTTRLFWMTLLGASLIYAVWWGLPVGSSWSLLVLHALWCARSAVNVTANA